jgi:error-prone DNA polymerase
LLGLLNVREVGPSVAEAIVREREANGPYVSVADLMERAGLRRESLDNLADAGALDSLALRPPAADPVPRGGPSARRRTKWEIGLRYRPVDRQLSLRLPVEQDMAPLPEATPWEVMTEEYRTMGLHPSSHLMAYLRDSLPGVLTSEEVWGMADGAEVRVAGLVVRRQRPSAKAYFITLEDEHGHTPMVVWPGDYVRLRHLLKEPVLLIVGTVSWREGTMNVVVRSVEALPNVGRLTPRSKDWG